MSDLAIVSISKDGAKAYFRKHSAFRGEFDLAIAVAEKGEVKGVIAMRADGDNFHKAHISTDGSAFLGSLLYGAMVRTAMAMGYKVLCL
jgi:hypothetical protein